MKASLQSLKSLKEVVALLMQDPEGETHVPKGCTDLALLVKHMKGLLWTPASHKIIDTEAIYDSMRGNTDFILTGQSKEMTMFSYFSYLTDKGKREIMLNKCCK